MSKEYRINQINELILELASGNFDFKGMPSETHDELDAIIVGINMLGEELKTSTVSRDYLNSIYRGVVDMLIILNPDRSIREVNSTVCDLLFYTKEELIGKDFSMLELTPDNSEFEELKTYGHCYSVVKTFKTKGGQTITVSCSCSALYNKQNKVDGFLYIAKDISKIKKTEEDLKSKNEELNTFVYKASHDLKGPLASMLGIVNIAENEITEDKAIFYLNLIKESAERLDSVLNDLLQVSRMKFSHLEMQKISFKALLDQILKSLSHVPGFNRISFEIDIKETHDYYSDPKVLTSVFQNLIDNAIKYHNVHVSNPKIEIKIDQNVEGVNVTIADNGIGIPKEYESRVFEMFYRATYQSKGTGLGLYIVKNAIEKLNAKISMTSIPDQGTKFQIFLPYLEY